MNKIRYIYWYDKDMYIGYLENYPDYITQGQTLPELEENLTDIYKEIEGGTIPGIRKIGELIIS
jgi:predicted RNase H-like HicB family nuclease